MQIVLLQDHPVLSLLCQCTGSEEVSKGPEVQGLERRGKVVFIPTIFLCGFLSSVFSEDNRSCEISIPHNVGIKFDHKMKRSSPVLVPREVRWH